MLQPPPCHRPHHRRPPHAAGRHMQPAGLHSQPVSNPNQRFILTPASPAPGLPDLSCIGLPLLCRCCACEDSAGFSLQRSSSPGAAGAIGAAAIAIGASGTSAALCRPTQEPETNCPPTVLVSLHGYSLHSAQASGQLPSTQPNASNASWISSFSVPWEKMPTRLSQAMARGGMAPPEHRRIMIRTVVEAMRVHCPNPNRAACAEVARAIVSKYPATFADKTADGEQLGCSYYSLLKQLKTRVEHGNRDNGSSRIRQPRKRPTSENNGGDAAIKRGRSELDSYGCINWQPTTLPEGETAETLETKRQTMSTVFRSAGPQTIETTDVNEFMSFTYTYQRHMLNSWPAPTLCEIQEHWPFLFTKRGLCTHFQCFPLFNLTHHSF
ncbi:uncharacterized protein LOC125879486 [Epinephelus fuscoguttatus]|uniref:uncharacterized protein LOC125879486 n=1 Tax=Epinephelus fuscoguttatus TaxID=293821 RepID=UPI0020D1564D|nr:uncharacterized protein LOC125879486 [Epinephelus fuscoguttatus]